MAEENALFMQMVMQIDFTGIFNHTQIKITFWELVKVPTFQDTNIPIDSNKVNHCSVIPKILCCKKAKYISIKRSQINKNKIDCELAQQIMN